MKKGKCEFMPRPTPDVCTSPMIKHLILTLRLCAFAGLFSFTVLAQGLPVAAPQSVGMNAARLNQIDAIVEGEIAAKKMPGAVVLIGHKGKIVFRKAYGNRS